MQVVQGIPARKDAAAQHDCQDPLIEYRFPKFFLQKVGMDPDDLHHVPTQDCEMLLIHRLHAICPQLRFAVASCASERQGHRRPPTEATKLTARPPSHHDAWVGKPRGGNAPGGAPPEELTDGVPLAAQTLQERADVSSPDHASSWRGLPRYQRLAACSKEIT
jgi:hypothetical protein